MRRLALAAVLSVLGLASCVHVRHPIGIQVSSDPPGARVWLDGKDTGFLTPTVMSLDEDRDHRLQLTLDGYAAREIRLDARNRWTAVSWNEGRAAPGTWPFPILLPARDFFMPIELDERPSPNRIHVRMRLAAEE